MKKLLTKAQTAALQLKLNQCCADIPEIQLLLLATVDGFQLVVAGSRREDTELPEKFAAIASSMTALAEAAGKELGSEKRLEAVVLDVMDLLVVFRMVNGDDDVDKQFVLAGVADSNVGLEALQKIVHANADLLEQALSEKKAKRGR